MMKKRAKKKTSDVVEVSKEQHPPGTTLYCWKFNHPKVGWCGGHDDDHWELSEDAIKQRMAICQEEFGYETELISKVTT